MAEAEPNNTLNLAQNLGTIAMNGSSAIVGRIGDAAGRSTDVDWYQFSIGQAAEVHLRTLAGLDGNTTPIVLTLYSSDQDTLDRQRGRKPRLVDSFQTYRRSVERARRQVRDL